MASTTKEYNTFVKGIITEASPLTFPEDASIDEENFILNRDGSRQRRLGMDYETSYTLSSNIPNSTFSDLAVATSEWRNADNDSTKNFAVVQIGATIYFYDLNQDPLSGGLKAFTVDLTTYKTSYAANIGSNPISTTVGKGILYVVSKDTDPFYVEYDSSADTISVTQISIEIRDFLGLDDGLDIDERSGSISNEHRYNLYNQGWDSTKVSSYYTAKSVYPSNADIWTLAKDSNDDFDPNLLDKQYFGNTPAPKGHYVLDAFTRDRTTVSGVSSLTTELEQGRPQAVAFYAGRVFYSGVESTVNAGPTLNGNIYFSQTLTDPAKSGYCYQEADPTAEDISDLIDTDGGVITIPEIGKVWKLIPVRDSLVVFADNGVWQIAGDVGAGFTATSYQVQKISNVGALNAESIVVVESSVLYWTKSGIYVATTDANSGLLNAQNITERTIQTLYQNIPSVGKLYAKGVYDVASKRVSWLYNDDDNYTGGTYKYKYVKELVFDTVLGAFYKNSISDLASNTPYVAGAVTTPDLQISQTAYAVVENGVQVQVNGVDVEVSLDNPARGAVATKYLIVTPQDATNSKVTWGGFVNTNFLEWESADSTGVDFSSYLITGHEIFGDTSRRKYIPYLIAHFNRTETGFVSDGSGGLNAENPSGCYMQARWGWANSDNSGRWSNVQQLYRLNRMYIPTGTSDTFDYGFEVVTTKTKMRGKGKAISIKFYSETGKDAHILGWAVSGYGSSTV